MSGRSPEVAEAARRGAVEAAGHGAVEAARRGAVEAARHGAIVFALQLGLGALSLVVQTFLYRELLVVVHGTELVLGLLFGTWLFWIGVSALAGIPLARRARRPRRALRLWLALGALAPLAQIELVRRGPALLGVPPGLIVSWPQALLLAVIAMAPFCTAVGATFPLACRVLAEQSSRGVGRLYMYEAAGALAGGVLGSFVLVGRVGPFAPIAAGAAGLAAVASLLDRGPARWAGIALAAALLGAWPAWTRLDEDSRRRAYASLMPGQELALVLDTPYEQLAVGRLEGQLTVYGNGLPEETLPDPYETPSVVYRLLAQAPAPRRILIVGAPESGLAREWASALDEEPATTGETVTFVHADAARTAAILPLLPESETAPLAARAHILVEDPRVFLAATAERFDLIFIDAPGPTAAYLNRFYTAEFFALTRRALSPEGILAFHLSLSSDYIGPEMAELAQSVRLALAESFPFILITPGEDSTWFASRIPLARDPAVIRARLAPHPAAIPFRDDIVLDYEPIRLARIEELLAAGHGATVNRDEHPSSYHYGAVLWDRFSSPDPTATSWLAQVHRALRGLGTGHAAVALFGLTLLGFALRRLAGKRAVAVDVGTAMLLAGAASMTLNLVLLLSYQSACGALYQRLAVMSALFMLGLALGSGTVARWAPRLRSPVAFLAGLTGTTALLALGLLPLLRSLGARGGLPAEVGHGLLFVLAGALLGAGYPASTEALLRGPARASPAAAGGIVDAVDHLGATAGALTAGSVVLPALGAGGTLLLLAAAGALVALGLVLAAARGSRPVL